MKKFVSYFLFINCIKLAYAGSPFISSDPIPEPYKHSAIYFFTETENDKDGFNFLAPAIQWQYGLLPHIELSIDFGLAQTRPNEESNATGITDTQLEIKYQFLMETKNLPAMAFQPGYFIPTGNADKGIGNGQGWFALPFYAQKSWGNWTVFGGGGLGINSAPDMKNFWFAGMVIETSLTEKIEIGGEIFSQTQSENSVSGFTILNIGLTAEITKALQLLFSAGHSIAGERNFITYVGILLNI